MTDRISQEEASHCREQLKRVERDITETEDALASYDGPIITGQSKNAIKGLMEQQLDNLHRQRAYFSQRLGNED